MIAVPLAYASTLMEVKYSIFRFHFSEISFSIWVAEGKCIYVYGRKRDLCHRNSDCDGGMACAKGPNGNLICQMPSAFSQTKQFGESCETSSECNSTKWVAPSLMKMKNYQQKFYPQGIMLSTTTQPSSTSPKKSLFVFPWSICMHWHWSSKWRSLLNINYLKFY